MFPEIHQAGKRGIFRENGNWEDQEGYERFRLARERVPELFRKSGKNGFADP